MVIKEYIKSIFSEPYPTAEETRSFQRFGRAVTKEDILDQITHSIWRDIRNVGRTRMDHLIRELPEEISDIESIKELKQTFIENQYKVEDIEIDHHHYVYIAW